jgi:hypothetical protein
VKYVTSLLTNLYMFFSTASDEQNEHLFLVYYVVIFVCYKQKYYKNKVLLITICWLLFTLPYMFQLL